MPTQLLRQPAFSGWVEQGLAPPAKKRKGPFRSEHEELQLPQPIQELSEPTWYPKLETPKKPRWKETADSFLKNFPTASVWRQKQVEVGLKSAKDYKKIIQVFISHSNVDIEGQSTQGAISRFKAFLLLSLCEASNQSESSARVIDQIKQYNPNISEDQRLRLQRGALWVNRLINELVKRGWNIYRARL